MHVVWDLIRFAGYASIVVFAVAVIAIIIAMIASKNKDRSLLSIQHVNNANDNARLTFLNETLEKKELKLQNKADSKIAKENAKLKTIKPKAYLLDFKGDIKASELENLRKEITLVLSVARPKDEVILRLESPGGMVHSYGLAAAQLERLKTGNIKITACVDRVAASGGYMMACIADVICAAPFALIGSIGVVAQIPNFHKILKKNDVEFHEITAGQYKRTLTLFGEVTSEKLHKFAEQIQETHNLFKEYVLKHRPNLDIQKIATGEYWYGQQALSLGLVDRTITSDDVVLEKTKDFEVYAIQYREKKSVSDRLSEALSLRTTGWVKGLLTNNGVNPVATFSDHLKVSNVADLASEDFVQLPSPPYSMALLEKPDII